MQGAGPCAALLAECVFARPQGNTSVIRFIEQRFGALPYTLHVHDLVQVVQIELTFVNAGKAGAVFHVNDKRNLERGPRR